MQTIFNDIIAQGGIINFNFQTVALVAIELLLVAVAFAIAMSRNLLSSLIFASLFSMLITLCYMMMDAPDVAMTEAALGVALSGAVFLNLYKRFNITHVSEVQPKNTKLAYIVCSICLIAFIGLIYELPSYGAESNVHLSASKYYIENTEAEIGIPSFVAAILASYRGYDTMGETLVILLAGLGVFLITTLYKRDI